MMRSSVFLTALLVLLAVAFPASAQLAGDDTAPGSSCAGFPEGATRVTADADLDGAQVVLICDGAVWRTQGVKVSYDSAACTAAKDGTIRYQSASSSPPACPAGGAEVAGNCWYLGDASQSCDTVCAGAGGQSYNSATQNYAGSGGNNAQCGAVLDAIGAPGSGNSSNNACGTAPGAGCTVYTASTRRRCTNTTNSTAAHANYRRACACGDGPVVTATDPLWEYCDGGAGSWRPFEHAGGGGGVSCTPSVNNVQTMTSTSSSATYTLSNYAVPDLNNRILIVTTHHDEHGHAVNSVTFGGQPLTKIAEVTSSNVIGTSMWYMLDPPATTANIVVNYGGVVGWSSAVTARVIDCAAQQPPEAFNATHVVDYNVSTSVTPLTDGAIVVDAFTTQWSGETGGPHAGQTTDWSANGWGIAETGAGISHKIAPAAGATSMGWVVAAGEGEYADLVAAAFAPAASGPMPPDCEDDSSVTCILSATRVDGDPEFIAANIASGVNILGVTGTLTGGGGGGSCFDDWTARDSNRYWNAIASSADGTKLVATVSYVDWYNGSEHESGRIYTSTDSGATWTQRDSANRVWADVASSADGTRLVGAVYGGRIYTSTDSGANWTQRNSDRNWKGAASSADGTRLAAVVYGGRIFTSTDSGVNWTQRDSTNRAWHSIASSADGMKLVAAGGDGIFTSTDGGANWTNRGHDWEETDWTHVASSADGSVLAAVTGHWWSAGGLLVSTDSGVNWTFHPGLEDRVFHRVAMSADGSVIAAGGGRYAWYMEGNMMFISYNTGVHWTMKDTVRAWSAVALSADGSKIVAAEDEGRIYTSDCSGGG